ncbi:hypothetical protein M758_11G016100 [Ceratodon purpureus]|nr:hypothetical protein M758_11G016100 [Ceratodon purpureus]
MEQEPGSETSASKIEGSSEGGSTSFRDRGEGDSNPEIISQDPGTTSGQVECARVTDNPNRVDDVAELQTRGAHEDVDHTSEQGGGSVISTEENVSSEDLSLNTKNSMEGTVTSSSDKEGIPAVSTGNDENQQTSDGWTLVESEKSEADTGGKGEVSRKMEKITGLIGEVQQNITEAHNSLHSDDTTRAKSLKNDPVVAKVAKTEREFAADNEREDNKAIEADDQATAEGSCEASVASGQGLKSSPADVTLATSKPDLVVSNAQGVERLSNSMSMKVTGRSNPLEILRPSKSWRDTLSYSKSPRGINVYSNSPKETSIGEEAPSTVLNSGTQKEVDLSLEDPRTVLNSGTQKEVDLSLEDPRAVLNSGTQKEVDLSLEDPRAVSRSDSLKEVSTSPEAEGEVSASEAQEVSRIVLEAPSPVPTSGALISQEDLSVVSNSVVQKDVDSISEALSTLSTSDAQEEVSANVEASGMVSNSDVGSSDSPNTVLTPEAQEKIEKSSNMKPNSEVQNEVSMTVDAPTKVCEAEGEISEVSEAPSTASTSEAQNGIRTSLEENIPRAEGSAPEGLQGKVSEVDEGKLRNSPQKSETTVCDVRGGLPEARCEEGKKNQCT